MRKPFWTTLSAVLPLVGLAAAALADQNCKAAADARKGVVTICASARAAQGAEPAPFFEEATSDGGVIGSGIVLSRDGLILTADHIVAGIQGISVVLYDLSEFKAAVVAADPAMDVAILRIPAGDLEPIPWRPDEPAEVGESVCAIGTPAVFSKSPWPSISEGIVSAVHRTIDEADGGSLRPYMIDLVESDVQVVPGQSGGALVDSQGRLIGMCMAVYFPTAEGRGRAFARPADAWFRAGLDVLAKSGRMPVGSLSIDVDPVSLDTVARFGLRKQRGVEVSFVTRGGPCERAGIMPRDIILAVNDRPVNLVSQFKQFELALAPGSVAKLSVFRAGVGQTLELKAVVAEAAPAVEQVELRWRGMLLRDVTRDLADDPASRSVQGVIVVDVEPGGKAYQAGLRAGNIIEDVNTIRVKSLHDFTEATKNIPVTEIVRVRTSEGIGHVKGENGWQ
jgi:S1-C subfamily serine protease